VKKKGKSVAPGAEVAATLLHFLLIGLVKGCGSGADGFGQSKMTLYVIRVENEAGFAVDGRKRTGVIVLVSR
jgi:hypothetical protein